MLLDDFKDRDGNWVPYVYRGKKPIMTCAGRLWYNMKSRCKDGGSIQARNPWYKGTRCEFESFNAFVDWAIIQPGYFEVDFHLDKDILAGSDASYGPNTCAFVPRVINNFFRQPRSKAGSGPHVGVSLSRRSNTFAARGNDPEFGSTFLGRFENAVDALKAYKSFKETVAKRLALTWKEKIDERVYEKLLNYTVDIN